MAHILSPVIMKKLLVNLFMTQLSVVVNAQVQDTISLKNGDKMRSKVIWIRRQEVRFQEDPQTSLYFWKAKESDCHSTVPTRQSRTSK